MEQNENHNIRVNHLAGIVPVAAPPLDFKMPWHDALMPIAPDYTAIEKAVQQCALAGCATIWVVCHMGTQPLLKKRLGDSIVYPYNFSKEKDIQSNYRASIFYVPINPKDRDKRDCLSWSVMHGANSAYRLCKFISRWVIPDKFFCCFPYCIIDDDMIKQNRKAILSSENIIFSYQNKTVRDGLHLNFTFKADQFKKVRRNIRFYVYNHAEDKTKKIQKSEYNKAAFIPLKEAFSALDLDGYNVVECPWFYDISTWEGYSTFIGAKIPMSINRKLFHNNRSRVDAFNENKK